MNDSEPIPQSAVNQEHLPTSLLSINNETIDTIKEDAPSTQTTHVTARSNKPSSEKNRAFRWIKSKMREAAANAFRVAFSRRPALLVEPR